MTGRWNVVTGSPSTVQFFTTYGVTTGNFSGWYPKYYQRVGEDYREVPAPSVPLPWISEPYVPSSDDYEDVPGSGANPYVYPFAPYVYPIVPSSPCVDPVSPPEPLKPKRARPGVPEEGEAETPLDQRVRRVLEDL